MYKVWIKRNYIEIQGIDGRAYKIVLKSVMECDTCNTILCTTILYIPHYISQRGVSKYAFWVICLTLWHISELRASFCQQGILGSVHHVIFQACPFRGYGTTESKNESDLIKEFKVLLMAQYFLDMFKKCVCRQTYQRCWTPTNSWWRHQQPEFDI